MEVLIYLNILEVAGAFRQPLLLRRASKQPPVIASEARQSHEAGSGLDEIATSLRSSQ